jgi:hypothetical protein
VPTGCPTVPYGFGKTPHGRYITPLCAKVMPPWEWLAREQYNQLTLEAFLCPAKAQAPPTQKDSAGSRITLIANTYANIVYNSSQNPEAQHVVRNISH